MRARLALAAALFMAAGSVAGAEAAPAEPPPDKALAAFFEREFMNSIEEFPEVGTFRGLEGYDHRVTDLSPPALARRKARVATALAELEKFDARKLSAQDRISRDMMLERLRLASREQAFYRDLPFGDADSWSRVSSMLGPHLTLPFIVKATRFRTVADYENYLKRLAALPRQLRQEIDLMRAGMRSGWMPPRAAMERVPAMFEVFAGTDVTAAPMWRPFVEFPRAVAEPDRARLAEAGRRVLAEQVHPAFAEMKRFLETEYLPACRAELSASTLPAGPAYYAHLMREQTTTELSADEVHALGLAEVARIRGEMDRVIAATGFKGTFAEFQAFLQKDPRFYFTRPEDRLREYRDIAKRADAELPKLFAELPRAPYGIRAMEAHEGDNSDNYSGPAIDGSRAGFFSANVNKLENRPSWEMESTLLHEAVPGHHLQIARAQELKGLPLFRRSGGNTAYVEGWALYAESLGYDMGFYRDPYQNFGRLVNEMLRAVRLVIDTGIHAKGWGREQAIRYFVDNGAGNPDYAAAEIDRYIVIPGQALAYKIGELRIQALRARARAALGDRFDLRRFHNAVLDDGALPLTVLERRIDDWINLEKGKEAMNRFLAALAAATTLAACPTLAQDFSKVEITATKLTETTYMLVGAGGNIGLSVGEDAVFVIDDQFAPLTPKITAAIARISPKPVGFVLNTHWHSDHAGGNENLGKAGALIVAHDNVRKRLSSEQFIEFINNRSKPEPKAALPVVTFGASGLSFHLNGEEIRAIHMPAAHTDGDAVVHFVGSDVIHMGDIYFNGMYPFIDTDTGGSADGVIAACDQVLKIASARTRIIPGHGPLSNAAELKAYRDMLATVSGRVKALVAQGRKLEEIVAAKVSAEWDEKLGNGFIKTPKFAEMLARPLLKR